MSGRPTSVCYAPAQLSSQYGRTAISHLELRSYAFRLGSRTTLLHVRIDRGGDVYTTHRSQPQCLRRCGQSVAAQEVQFRHDSSVQTITPSDHAPIRQWPVGHDRTNDESNSTDGVSLFRAGINPKRPFRKSKLGLVDNAVDSTLEHRLWVGFGAVAVMGVFVKAVTSAYCHDESDEVYGSLQLVLGAILGYVVSDLFSGVVHWIVDNYGDDQTPFFGASIDAAQGHHQRPRTITRRHFANNVHVVSRSTGFFLIPFLAVPSQTFCHSFLAFVAGFGIISQQCHAWAHTPKARIPRPVVMLHSAGLLLSPKDHGPHHLPPHESTYCIVSGIWNSVLRDTQFFRVLERFIFDRWGVAPRCWGETSEEWLQQPGGEDFVHED